MPPTRSIILPAFNEAHRLPPYLERIRAYLEHALPGEYEVLVVNDGSTDDTARIVADLADTWPGLRLLAHGRNRGKGAAVRTGMLAAEGEWLLMADADGATPIEEEARLADALRAGADVAIGSRLLDDPSVARRRTRTRAVVGRLFAGAVRCWLGLGVHDTQCGFKMFRRDVARALFAQSVESGYLFDVELLLLAQRRGYRVAEVPINWSEVPGGHLSMGRELGRVLVGLWRLRWRGGGQPDSGAGCSAG
jgi:dolichyl-phosphate beta-glucosyltransferase